MSYTPLVLSPTHSRNPSADMKQISHVTPEILEPDMIELRDLSPPETATIESSSPFIPTAPKSSHLRRISGANYSINTSNSSNIAVSGSSTVVSSDHQKIPSLALDKIDNEMVKEMVIDISRSGGKQKEVSASQYEQWADFIKTNHISILLFILILICVYDSIFPSSLTIKAMMMDPFSKFIRLIAHPIVDFLLPIMWITPDHITWMHLCLGIVGSFFVASANHRIRVFGAFIHFLRHLLDHIDGPLARARRELMIDQAQIVATAAATTSVDPTSVIDFDMIADTIGSISFGIAVFWYFYRSGIRPERGLIFVGVLAAVQITLKGLILDYLMEVYKLHHIRPAIISCFFWKISSYDFWENLKLFALVTSTELEFYSFSAVYGLLWVGLPTMISVLDLFFFLA